MKGFDVMLTLIKSLQKEGFTVWFVDNDTFYINDYNCIITYATVKKGKGRRVLIQLSTCDSWKECSSQKECLEFFLSTEK